MDRQIRHAIGINFYHKCYSSLRSISKIQAYQSSGLDQYRRSLLRNTYFQNIDSVLYKTLKEYAYF